MDGAGNRNENDRKAPPPPVKRTAVGGLNQTQNWEAIPSGFWGDQPPASTGTRAKTAAISEADANAPFAAAAPGVRALTRDSGNSDSRNSDSENDAEPWSSPGLELQAGGRIAQYEIIRKLGSGGMGVVYLARDNRLGRKVAIKLLRAREPEFTSRFLIEAQTTARCTHENIVVIHEVGEHQGDPFMVLEYLEGNTLADLRGTPQPVARIIEIMAGVVRALTRAHREGIVHRDLKPENIFLTQSGTVKVLDFGIAKLLQDDSGPQSRAQSSFLPGDPRAAGVNDRKSTISGTMAYMSPEQWGIAGEIDHRTDIWAVGLILYELLSGRHPLETIPDALRWVRELHLAFPPLQSAAPRVPPELGTVIDTCLRKLKEERYGDANALLRALEPFLPGHHAAGPIQLELGPYAGLRAFQEEDATRFFGRDKEIATLATRLLESPLVGVVGPSGIGKSSLLRAGVIPTLKASGDQWKVIVARPGRDPMASLARVISPMVSSGLPAAEEQKLQNDLRAKLIMEPGYFGNVLRAEARRLNTRLLILIDQFEELYTLETHALARRAFTSCLTGAADDAASPLRVVTTLRADFLGRVAEDPNFMDEFSKGLVFLGPPTPEGLRQALTRPAELAGYRFETETMVNEMVNYLESTPGGLPLLQFAAAQLWETRDPSRKLLTEGAYRGLGGVAGALVSHADKVLSKLSPNLKALCRNLFVQLVTPERTRAVRRLDELRELVGGEANADDVERLLHHLVESRLVVTQSSEGAASAEIVHESLINNWPMLRRWLDESQEDGVFLDQLLAAARQWNNNRRDPGLLWGGDMVVELERFERRYKGKLPQITKDFAEAVYAVARSGTRKRRALAVGGVLVLLGLLAAAAIALVVIRKSQLDAQQAALEAKSAHNLAKIELEERKRAEEKQRALSEELKGALLTLQTANSQLEDRKLTLEQRESDLKFAMTRLQQAVNTAESSKSEALAQKQQADAARVAAQKAKEQAVNAYEEQKERVDILTSKVGSIVRDLR
jgi:eukaryotic-like serine/threonine-protein kinase